MKIVRDFLEMVLYDRSIQLLLVLQNIISISSDALLLNQMAVYHFF